MMHEAFESSPPRRAVSPRRSSPQHRALSPCRALSPRRYDQSYDDRDFKDQFRQTDRRFRPESLERVPKEKEKYPEDVPYRRRYIAEPKLSNRSVDRDERSRRDRDVFPIKLQRGVSESSLKVSDTSPKDRFNVAKEKFMNLERERFNRELEQHMAMRRSMLERNGRSTSSPEEDSKEDRVERRERPTRDVDRTSRDVERSSRDLDRPLRDVERYKRDMERPIREMERLPRVGRKREDYDRYEYGSEEFLDRRDPEYRYRDRRELDRRIEEDEIIEPVIEERPRRDWTDRQRAFSRSRLLEDQRKSYIEGERDYRDLAERKPVHFRHSYAEPIPRGRLGAVRPY